MTRLRLVHATGIRSFVCHGNHDPLDGWKAGRCLAVSVAKGMLASNGFTNADATVARALMGFSGATA